MNPNTVLSFTEANKIFKEESAKRANEDLKRMGNEIRKSINGGETYAEVTITGIHYVRALRKALRKLGYSTTYESAYSAIYNNVYTVRCYLNIPWWRIW